MSELRAGFTQDTPAGPFVAAQIAPKQGSLFSRLRNIFSKRDELCVEDDFYYYLRGIPEANTFCNIWISIPPATTTVDYTSTITAIDVTATLTDTVVNTIRTTTVITVTATEAYGMAMLAKEKRGAAPAPTQPPLIRRNALLNGIAAVVTHAISGTVASSADMPAGTAKASIDAGLSSACSCLDYQPLSTFTVTYTDLPYFTTLDAFEQGTLTLLSTIIRTSYTTQTITQTTNTGLVPSTTLALSSPPLNSTAYAATYVSADLNNTASMGLGAISSSSLDTAASSTVSTVTPVTVIGGPGRASSEARTIATSLPISCPENNNQTITNIVGNERFEFLVSCDVNVLDNTTILSTSVAGPTECAAECSFVNDAFQEALCQSAVFVPTVGNDNCVLKKSAEAYTQAAGYVSFILLNTFTGGNDSTCSPDTFAGTSISVDTSSLIASITSASLSVTQLPYAVSTGGGGEFSTYYSHGEFDSAGVYHWSNYYVGASSSSWYVEYASSWTCTVTYSQTIVIPQTITNGTGGGSNTAITVTTITTIIHGSTTTIIDGGATTIIINTNGQTMVPASLTSGGGVFSTGGSTVVLASYGRSGVIFPASTTSSTETMTSMTATATIVSIGTAVSGGASSSGFGNNMTRGVVSESIVSGGSGETTSSGFYNANSTGGAGVISPSVSTLPILSGTISSSEIAPVTSVGSGIISFNTSTNALGVATTLSSGLTPILSFNGSTSSTNVTVIVITTVISGVTSEYISTGGFGAISPTSEVASASISSLRINQTVTTINETIYVGTTVTSGATSIYMSTGGLLFQVEHRADSPR
ncbi:hypothetical protein AOQ84DRAFT_227837 [Glonium stellatum]|uniref:Uncharacterized protein n=1 Tax=Glonium stellatum TaxID=574774 RepID=A0A8E2F8F7_9PEZI|nr:hypothetical protein AOQ84DRAFT_227837 [Glonium stellatum]